MGKYTFDIQAAYGLIVDRVTYGLNVTADEIVEMAVELAPVRKKGRRKKRTTAVGGVRTKHSFPVGRRRSIAVTGGQFWQAFSKLPAYTRKDGSKEVITRAQFRQMKMFDRARNPRVISPEGRINTKGDRVPGYDERAASTKSGKLRGAIRGSEVTGPEGHLRDRIEAEKPLNENGLITVTIRSEAPYSRYVEFPTRRTAAQPFLLPAFKAARSRLKANIKAAKGG